MEQLSLLFHYPDADAAAGLLERMKVVRDAMAAVPGCVEVDIWREADTDALVAVSRWQDAESLAAARAVLVAADLPIEASGEHAERKRVVLERVTATDRPAPVYVLSYESAADVYET